MDKGKLWTAAWVVTVFAIVIGLAFKDFLGVLIGIAIVACVAGIGIGAELMGFDSRVHGKLAEDRAAREKRLQPERLAD